MSEKLPHVLMLDGFNGAGKDTLIVKLLEKIKEVNPDFKSSVYSAKYYYSKYPGLKESLSRLNENLTAEQFDQLLNVHSSTINDIHREIEYGNNDLIILNRTIYSVYVYQVQNIYLDSFKDRQTYENNRSLFKKLNSIIGSYQKLFELYPNYVDLYLVFPTLKSQSFEKSESARLHYFNIVKERLKNRDQTDYDEDRIMEVIARYMDDIPFINYVMHPGIPMNFASIEYLDAFVEKYTSR